MRALKDERFHLAFALAKCGADAYKVDYQGTSPSALVLKPLQSRGFPPEKYSFVRSFLAGFQKASEHKESGNVNVQP